MYLCIRTFIIRLLFPASSSLTRLEDETSHGARYVLGDISTARAITEQMDPMLSNGSRGTLMSYTDNILRSAA